MGKNNKDGGYKNLPLIATKSQVCEDISRKIYTMSGTTQNEALESLCRLLELHSLPEPQKIPDDFRYHCGMVEVSWPRKTFYNPIFFQEKDKCWEAHVVL